jgi:hypothetical protein
MGHELHTQWSHRGTWPVPRLSHSCTVNPGTYGIHAHQIADIAQSDTQYRLKTNLYGILAYFIESFLYLVGSSILRRHRNTAAAGTAPSPNDKRHTARRWSLPNLNTNSWNSCHQCWESLTSITILKARKRRIWSPRLSCYLGVRGTSRWGRP